MSNLLLALLAAPAAAIIAAIGLPLILLPRPRRHRRGACYDVIVVLGAMVEKDGTAGPMLRNRIAKAAELFHEGAAPRLILTGAAAHNRWVEAEVMAAGLQAHGVPQSALILESRARTTAENAHYSAIIIQEHEWQRVLVVSSAPHLARATALFAREGVRCHVAACQTPPGRWWRRRILFPLWERYYCLRLALGMQPPPMPKPRGGAPLL